MDGRDVPDMVKVRILLELEVEDFNRVESLRGNVSRSKYVRELVLESLNLRDLSATTLKKPTNGDDTNVLN